MAVPFRSLVVALVIASPAVAAPTPEQVKQAIENLASPRFAVREQASKLLWEAGKAAEADLRVAAKSKDEETANRAKAILDKFDWGLYPDTPADVVRLIEKFRGGNPETRREAVGELIHHKPARFDILRKVIANEQDPETRKQMYERMAFQARDAVPTLIVAGDLNEANELLEICLSPNNPPSLTDYAAFQFLRNRVPDAISRLEEMRKKGSEADVRRATEALVYLYRVKQDWPAARQAADASKNRELQLNLAWESNDWKRLAEGTDDGAGDPDDRGARAAYYRLAGDKAKSDELISELRKDLMGVEGDDRAAYSLAYALLLNGRGADAIEVLKGRTKRGADLVFDLLCAQLKFKEAFAYYDTAMKELENDPEAEIGRHQLAVRRGAVLAALGDRDGATQVFRGVFDKALAAGPGELLAVDVVKTVARTGMRDLAADLAARCLARFDRTGRWGEDLQVLQPIFEGRAHLAWTWWTGFRNADPKADPAATMAQVLEFVDGKADRKKADRLAELLDKAVKASREANRDNSGVVPWVLSPASADFAIAEAYRIVGATDQADEFYKKAISFKTDKAGQREQDPFDDLSDDEDLGVVPTPYRYLLAYGDFLTGLKRPKEAAAIYRKAWEVTPGQPLPLFLCGHSLKLAGDEKEGTRLMGLAHWVPLGNEAARARFGDDLAKRGFDADSRKEMDLVLSVGWFNSYLVANVHLRMARIKARHRDFATAAKMYEKDVASLFRTGGTFVDPKGYLTVPELARTYRARALLAAGKVDEALSEAKTGLATLPANIELALGLVPDLDRAGKRKDADDIYRHVKAAYETALKDYSTSADLQNSVAWMMVNCNRDLDEALAHAKKAVENAPKAAGYIDTLAEVYFRKKDRAKAMELMKQCAALEPTNPYYRKQFERFEKKPFDSPLPDEETGDD